MNDLLRTKVPEAEIGLGAAPVDNQERRTRLALNLYFNLACIPDACSLAQAKVSERLHGSRIPKRLFFIYGIADRVVEPGAYLTVVRAVGCSGNALQDVAIARPKPGSLEN